MHIHSDSMSEQAQSSKEAGSRAWTEGRFLEAIEHFGKAITLSSGDRELQKVLYSNRSACYLKLKRNAEALLDANKCLEIDSTWSKGLMRKADALRSLTRYAEAAVIYESLLRASPHDNAIRTKVDEIRQLVNANASPFVTNIPLATVSGSPYDFYDRISTIQSYIRLSIIIFGIGYFFPINSISAPCHR